MVPVNWVLDTTGLLHFWQEHVCGFRNHWTMANDTIVDRL
jgi:hypothetical protein